MGAGTRGGRGAAPARGKSASAVVPALLLSLTAACAGGDERPNVVLVVIDTLRADRTTLGGHARDTTPRLAALAERGFVFEAARSTAPWTKPSVASLFTGLDPRAHGMTTHVAPLHTGHRTLAEAFRQAGYATIGVQSNLYLLGLSGLGQGFDAYEDETTDDSPDATVGLSTESTGARVNRAALRRLDALADDRPFFLYVHHFEPHYRYLRDELVPPDRHGLDEATLELLAAATTNDLVSSADRIDARMLAYLEDRYDSEVLYQDGLLGELLDALDERGRLERTVVAVTADHGEEFLDHGSVSHGNDRLFDELLHVPLVLAGPGVPRRRCAAPVSLLHLGRTLLDLAGADVPFPGTSLAPFLRGESPELPVVSHGTRVYPDGRRTELDALVVGRWKLVRDLAGGGERLYDLERDPEELYDVAAENAETVARLARLAVEHVRAHATPRELGPERPEVLREREAWLGEKGRRLDAHLADLGYAGGDAARTER